MDIQLRPGVVALLDEVGEQALSVELTLDFEYDGTKNAVAWPGASDASVGFEYLRVGKVDVWWRQMVLTASARQPTAIRPRRVVIRRRGNALEASAQYA